MFLAFLEIVKGGGTPVKRILEGLFSRFWTKITFYRPSKQTWFYVSGVFGDSKGRGTPVKRICEGLS